MSTAADIWEVMAEEISGHVRNPLETFLGRAGLSGVSISRQRADRKPVVVARPVDPAAVPVYVVGVTLREALAAETRGEGVIRFVGGVPQWFHGAPVSPAPRPRTLLDRAEPLAPASLDESRPPRVA